MSRISKEDKRRLHDLEKLIGHDFSDITHLYQALIHKSYINEVEDPDLEDNERYEFMGDSILEFISTKYLFEKYPDEPEGVLTLRRSCIVDRDNCASIAGRFALGNYVFLGKGERREGEEIKQSILANAFEALVCAVYLDAGMDRCEEFVVSAIERFTPDIETQTSRNFKAEFQTYTQKMYQKVPLYRDILAVGPDHEKIFEVSVSICGKPYGTGRGPSKKIAQQRAAQAALARIKGEESELVDG